MITLETSAVQDRLVELIQLQVLYNRLHAVQQKKGDLPRQIEELHDQAAALVHSLQELSRQIDQLEGEIRTLHVSNDSLRDHEAKLQKTLLAVRNEQEYYKVEADLKETQLTIEKNLKDMARLKHRLEAFQQRKAAEEERLREIQALMAEKEEALSAISRETQKQEAELKERIEKLSAYLAQQDERLFRLFERRRRSLREGRALVPVVTLAEKEERVACGGCYTLLPRQLQWQLTQRNTIFVCESCGRILVDAAFFEEVAAAMP